MKKCALLISCSAVQGRYEIAIELLNRRVAVVVGYGAAGGPVPIAFTCEFGLSPFWLR